MFLSRNDIKSGMKWSKSHIYTQIVHPPEFQILSLFIFEPVTESNSQYVKSGKWIYLNSFKNLIKAAQKTKCDTLIGSGSLVLFIPPYCMLHGKAAFLAFKCSP